MTWIRQAATGEGHVCATPSRDVGYLSVPDGAEGDLWSCDGCPLFWEIRRACDACDRYGDHPEGGMCKPGMAWRVARPGTLVRNWNKIVPPEAGLSRRTVWVVCAAGVVLLTTVMILLWVVR